MGNVWGGGEAREEAKKKFLWVEDVPGDLGNSIGLDGTIAGDYGSKDGTGLYHKKKTSD